MVYNSCGYSPGALRLHSTQPPKGKKANVQASSSVIKKQEVKQFTWHGPCLSLEDKVNEKEWKVGLHVKPQRVLNALPYTVLQDRDR